MAVMAGRVALQLLLLTFSGWVNQHQQQMLLQQHLAHEQAQHSSMDYARAAQMKASMGSSAEAATPHSPESRYVSAMARLP